MPLTYFTFGQSHMTNYPLPNGGRLADYWVTVDVDDPDEARQVFIEEFTTKYCPNPTQFARELDATSFDPDFFPEGELCRITRRRSVPVEVA